MAKELLFFKTRRETEIGDFQSLKSRGSERRAKVPMRIPLSNRPTSGIPEWILQGYEFVVKDDSAYDRSNCKEMRLEGMSVDFFTTDSVKRKMMALNACTINRFYVQRVGEDDKAIVYLNCTVYAPCSEEIIIWLYKHQDATVFAEFDATQASLEYKGEGEDEDESDDQEEIQGDLVMDGKAAAAGDESAAAPAPARRSHHKKKE